MSTDLKTAVAAILEEKYWYSKQPDGSFRMEIYADYRDEMDARTAAEICQSSDPELALQEKLEEWYFEAECVYQAELEKEIRQALTAPDGPYPEGLGDDEDDLSDIITELTYWVYPEDHFLKQEFCVNILLDTGDGNYDFTLNSPYPCWYGDYNARLDEKSSLLWLARQQGYTKTQLWRALREGDMRDPKGFLESCRVECANLPSGMAAVTFLVRMTLARLRSSTAVSGSRTGMGAFMMRGKIPTAALSRWARTPCAACSTRGTAAGAFWRSSWKKRYGYQFGTSGRHFPTAAAEAVTMWGTSTGCARRLGRTHF